MPIETLTKAGAMSALGARKSFTDKMPGHPRNTRCRFVHPTEGAESLLPAHVCGGVFRLGVRSEVG